MGRTMTLDEIIEHAYNAGYSAKDQVKQAILQWVADEFGRGEPEEYAVGQYTYGDTPYDSASVNFGRNEVRAEILQKLKVSGWKETK